MRKLAHACLFASLAFSIHGVMAATAGAAANCSKPGCTVTVSVGGNSCGAGIAVSPDPVIVDTSKGGPVIITWKVTGGWEFAENGIALGTPDIAGVEINKLKRADKVTFTAINAAKTKGDFKYDINLLKGEAKCSLDPTIVNH